MSNHLSGKEVIANGTYIDISRSRLDLVVLRHMARNLHMALELLRDVTIREHVKGSTTHAYAAYQLAPLYYEWVRLHHGILPSELAQGDMQLLGTKYYTFHVRPHKPIIIERSYTVHGI